MLKLSVDLRPVTLSWFQVIFVNVLPFVTAAHVCSAPQWPRATDCGVNHLARAFHCHACTKYLSLPGVGRVFFRRVQHTCSCRPYVASYQRTDAAEIRKAFSACPCSYRASTGRWPLPLQNDGMDMLESLRDASHSVTDSRHLLKTAFNKQWLKGLSNDKIGRIRASLLPSNGHSLVSARPDEMWPVESPNLDGSRLSAHSTDTLMTPSPAVPEELGRSEMHANIPIVSPNRLTRPEDRTCSQDANDRQNIPAATQAATLGSILRNVSADSQEGAISPGRLWIDPTGTGAPNSAVVGRSNASHSGYPNFNPATRPATLGSILRNVAVDTEASFGLVCLSLSALCFPPFIAFGSC